MIIDTRLFIRLLIGIILLSGATSKIIHLQRFQQGIQDYHLLPSFIGAKSIISLSLALCIVLAELGSGLGLILGIQLHFTIAVIQSLFALFCGALIMNLLRGRKDLSCHCGGVLGNHPISWKLVARNVAVIFSLLIILVTPSDPFTINALTQDKSTLTIAMWINVAIPVMIVTVSIIFIGVLLNMARSVLGKKNWS